MNTPKLRRILITILSLRVIVVFIRSFLPLGGAEVWRQTVTLGVSLRYWSRWALEPHATHLVLPAVLDSGDTQGIMPTEFPILNGLGAPGFACGPWVGRALAVCLLASTVFLLTFWNASIWRGKKVAGIPAELAMLLLPVFSISLGWAFKFMPDFLSVLLVTIAVGLSWEHPRRRLSFVLATLGILMKPTAIIVFCLFLAYDGAIRRKLMKWKQETAWILPAVLVAGLYYTFGTHWIARYEELPSLVGLSPRPMIPGLVGFFTHNDSIRNFYFFRAFFPGGFYLLLGMAALMPPLPGYRRLSPLWMISVLQILITGVLDGGQLYYNHDYYLIGTAPVFCLLFIEAWQRARWGLLRAVLIGGLCVPLIETSAMDLKSLYRDRNRQSLDAQAADLKSRHPEIPWGKGIVFRSSVEPYPTLGLTFGEREGSKTSDFGFFWKSEGIPASYKVPCKVIDQSEEVLLAHCSQPQA